MSSSHIAPDLATEIFVLDRPVVVSQIDEAPP
jgi:hypothetical protein